MPHRFDTLFEALFVQNHRTEGRDHNITQHLSHLFDFDT